ncbi:MAG TPA: matrixin family metalloprotease [Phycisphaerae bacterium]|nr:matrixin family metalloprotease [Phycisphaerae bacterium]HNU46834.1 matrixin family metalloprotease [Phycisphaerae bacterium]
MFLSSTNSRGMPLASACLFVAVLLFVHGCDTGAGWTGDRSDGSTASSTLIDPGSSDLYTEAKLNNALEQAEPLELTTAGLTIDGAVIDTSDVDVFDFGPAAIGDRIYAQLQPSNGLNGAVALFDASGNCLLVNDHRNVYLGDSVPFIDLVMRQPTENCYLAVTTTPLYESPGSYQLYLQRVPGQPQSPYRPETILLHFAGATKVTVGGRDPVDVPPFDAADIDRSFRGQTDEIVADVVARVREDFAGFNVTILSTSEGARYDNSMTCVYFGTYDPGLLGVAEGVDEFNTLGPQEAFVFTDTFAAFMVISPTADELSQALANVASHEAGHLLGLVHTTDYDDLMDITASLNRLLQDQYFTRAPLHPEVFPLGYQDGVQTLLNTAGGDAEAVQAALAGRLEKTPAARVNYGGPPARATLLLSAHRPRTGGYAESD